MASKAEAPPEAVKTLPIRLSPELHEWLRVRAFNERRSMAQLVLEALERYRKRVER